MSDSTNFHEIALKSILFKGRDDWYYCFLKAEKIAHVLVLLSSRTSHDLEEVLRAARELPKTICYFAAGELAPEVVLADLFALVSALRIRATLGHFSNENIHILTKEYEGIIERVASQNQPSPFISTEDFVVPQVKGDTGLLAAPEASDRPKPIGTHKGHKDLKDIKTAVRSQKDRTEVILEIVRNNEGISIKDIAAKVRDCSEKTIQRELVGLIERGLVQKIGERRWSLYVAARQG